jgi:hypothetical protein
VLANRLAIGSTSGWPIRKPFTDHDTEIQIELGQGLVIEGMPRTKTNEGIAEISFGTLRRLFYLGKVTQWLRHAAGAFSP